MNRIKTYINTGLLLLITVIVISFSFDVYGQENNQEEEECRLTREENIALVGADELSGNDDFAGARKTLLDYLATNPVCVTETFYRFLAQVWYFDKSLEESVRIKESIKVIEKGYAEYPENEKILLMYTNLLTEGEYFAKAAPLWETAYETIMKKDITYLKNAATCYYQAKKPEDAKRIYLRLIELYEKPDRNLYNSVILICEEQGKMEEAEGFLIKALDVFPADAAYWQLLGNYRLEKEDYSGAGGAFEINSYIKPPETVKEGRLLIDLYRALNVPLRVAKKMKQALENEKNPKDEDHLLVVSSYTQAMRIDEAIAYLDKIIAKEHSAKLMLEKAKTLYDARRYKQAVPAFDDVIAADPKLSEAYFWKGWSAVELKDWITAREAFRKALADKTYRDSAKNAIDVLDNLDEAREN